MNTVLAAAAAGVMALSSGVLLSSPAQAADGCGYGFRWSPYWGRCVPMRRGPDDEPQAYCREGWRWSERRERCVPRYRPAWWADRGYDYSYRPMSDY